ncbi:MAG TPA: FkbM family methyltransferase [Puia sp.]|nr:FkbM family methyltransferase [Puia sp.]
MKKFLKKILFGQENREMIICYGLARNIRMNIDPRSKTQRLLGLDEREIQKTFKTFARASEIFVDIGASDGYYGLMYYKLHPDGEIYLFDAGYAFAAEQKMNFERNGFSTNRLHNISKYVCDYSDETHAALDTLLEQEPGVIFLKIDVDGGEMEVLKGVTKVLGTRTCKLIIETHSKELEDQCLSLLLQLGYRTAIIPNAWWRFFVPEERPIAHNRWLRAEN